MKSFIIAGRLVRQINGDKRTLVIMILAPVLIMTLLYFLLASGITTVYIDVVGNDSTDTSALKTLAEVHVVPSESDAKTRLEEGKSDGYINGDKYVVEGSDPAINALAQRAFTAYAAQQHLSSLPPQVAGLAQSLSSGVDVETYFGSSDYEQFDFLAPSMMAFMFCGLFNLRETPVVLQYLAKIFPLSYGADALRNVMLRGRGIDYIWPDLLVMLGFTALFFLLNIRALKKYRSI